MEVALERVARMSSVNADNRPRTAESQAYLAYDCCTLGKM